MKALPNLIVENIRVAFKDEGHNAFTDLCRFRGHLYLTFRSCPEGHGVCRHACIRILRSADGADWEEVFEFSVLDRDTRDPHFLVFGERLFVYTGTWLCPAGETEFDINEHLGYGSWTADGVSWHGPVMLEGTYGHYVWRAQAFGAKAYLCARRRAQFAHDGSGGEGGATTQAAMLESDDGLIWRYRGQFAEHWGDETAFVFDPAGVVTAVSRRLGDQCSLVCRAAPPYSEWQRVELDRSVGGPMIALWGKRLLVGGRKTLGGPAVTTLYWLVNNQLAEICELPSGGDTSYPGFVKCSETRGLLSYYSSHETGGSAARAAIYLADLVLQP